MDKTRMVRVKRRIVLGGGRWWGGGRAGVRGRMVWVRGWLG